ncbi:hypothetical protein EW146_g7707 [Bondarzewia mesenterica]|uniref:Uncharacterized protein n=1 Tax=Bondarzewia mesenterica TaxID=1095465 RepID=A0A4S4LK32_9AGAM|nr:hypothetical protein EW146_g7707 [Bondarzewia mesenterica]
MGLGKLVATAAAWRESQEMRVSSQHEREDPQAALLGVEASSDGPISHSVPRRSYGATESGIEQGYGGMSRTHSPETYRNALLARVPEDRAVDEEEDEIDEELFLEERGIYIGSYKYLVSLYTLVPVVCTFLWFILAFLPPLLWHTQTPAYPAPFPELLISTSLWSLSHLLSTPLYTLASAVLPPLPSTLISTALHVLLRTFLRLAALPLLRIRHHMDYPHPQPADPAFWRVWWLALGWSLAEVAVGVAQGYDQLALYQDVLVPAARVHELGSLTQDGAQSKQLPPRSSDSSEHGESSGSAHEGSTARANASDGETAASGARPDVLRQRRPSEAEMRLEVDRDLDQLVALKAREELEELYGIPFVRIPVFVSCLLRIASIVLSLGFMLLISAAYLSAPLSIQLYPTTSVASYHPPGPIFASNAAFYITFAVVFVLHLALSLLQTSMVLPRIGIHVVAYVGFLVGLGSVFAGLGMWGALA